MAAILASGATAQPQVDPASIRPVAMTPVPLAQGLGEFERICLGTGFDSGRFSAAVDASSWRFRKEQGLGTPKPDVRRAPAAVVTFHGPPTQESRAFAPGQCNMEWIAQDPADRQAVLAELAEAVTRATGSAQPSYDFPGETCFRWTMANDRIARLCLMQPRPGAHPQQLALSHQLWTAAGEARARLTPPVERAR